MSFTISIGGELNYEIASFETTPSNHGLQITTNDPQGKIVFKLGDTAGSNSCFKILDSDGNSIVEKASDKKVTNTGAMSIHGSLAPVVHEHIRFSSMSWGNEKGQGTMRDGNPLNFLLNLIDLCGYKGLCKFNKFEWYISEIVKTDFCTMQVAIYKLDSSATFGDYTTYENSKLVSISNKIHWNNKQGYSGSDGLGFVTFNFANTVEISQSTDGVENRYFIALSVTSASPDEGVIYRTYGTTEVGIPSRAKGGYIYLSTLNTQLEYNMVDDRINNHGVYPYFSVFYKKYTKNSWIIENGYKYYIDSQGRKYRLLIKQDLEKTLSGAVQSAAGWAADSVSILATNTYWNGSVLATVAYPDPETESEFLDMRGDVTGSDYGFQWEEYRDYDGLLEMKMEWPGIVDQGYDYNWTSSRSYPFNFEDAQGNVTDYMTWKQSVTPTTSSLTIPNSRVGTGYQAIDEGINNALQNGTFADLQFVGTTKHIINQSYTDGGANSGTKWYFAAGAFNLHQDGIPVFTISSTSTDKVIASKVNLYLRVPDPRDVYLFLGQSNMVGRGTVSELTAAAWEGFYDVRMWNAITPDTAWSLVSLGTTSDNSGDFGPEIAFAKLSSTRNPCHIWKYAVSGADLANDFAARTGPQYINFLSKLKDALNTSMDKSYRIRGVLWAQGEADAGVEADANAYEANLKNFIKCVREDLNIPYLPFSVARINAPQKTYRDAVRNAQDAVAASDTYVNTFSTDSFPLSDNLHFNTSGTILCGESFYSSIISLPDEHYKLYDD